MKTNSNACEPAWMTQDFMVSLPRDACKPLKMQFGLVSGMRANHKPNHESHKIRQLTYKPNWVHEACVWNCWAVRTVCYHGSIVWALNGWALAGQLFLIWTRNSWATGQLVPSVWLFKGALLGSQPQAQSHLNPCFQAYRWISRWQLWPGIPLNSFNWLASYNLFWSEKI